MDMNPGIKRITKDIDKLVTNFAENSKIAEELCYDIGFHLDKAGELSDKLSRYMNKINKDYADYFEHNKVATVIDIGKLYDEASGMLADVGSQWRKSATVFSRDMLRMFSFGTYENEGFQKLIEMRNNFSETYEEAKINLERKKVILFEQKDLRRWGIDPKKLNVPAENVLANPTLAKKYMLPQETNSVRNLRDFVGYFNKQLLDEIDVFTSLMLERMHDFFRRYVRISADQVENQSRHLKLISDKLGDIGNITEISSNLL